MIIEINVLFTAVAGAVVSVIAFLINRSVFQRIDKMEDKLDRLIEKFSEMDSAVLERLSSLEAIVERIPAPWQPHKTNNSTT